MKVIAYLIYGNKKEYQLELSYSILSAQHFLKTGSTDIKICVVSDRQSSRNDLPVEYMVISPEEFAEWTLNGTYNHRSKLYALKKVMDHYQCPVALVDTDTYFIGHPAQIFERIAPGCTVMHERERTLMKSPPFHAMIPLLGNGICVAGVDVSPQSVMFNSGVIGLDPVDRPLLDHSLQLLDELYELLPIFNVEQFAVGHILNLNTQLSMSDDLIRHYWGYEKGFIHIRCSQLFTQFTPEKFDSLLAAETLPNVGGYPKKSKRDLLRTKILSKLKKWDDLYQFGYLAYRSSLSAARCNPEDAYVWVDITLQVLHLIRLQEQRNARKSIPISQLKADFKYLSPALIHKLGYLNQGITQRWLNFWDDLEQSERSESALPS